MYDVEYGCAMYALDFEYDGQYLSDYGCLVCDFDNSSGTEVASAGSVITFNTVPRNQGKNWSLTSTQYDECIQATFQICKDPNRYDDIRITDDEYRSLMRWLNRREYLRFQVLDEDNKERVVRYYNASFNVAKIKIQDVLYGLELTMETDRPFAYADEYKTVLNITDTKKKYTIYDASDEIGFVYPSMVVTCNGDGDLRIENDLEPCVMEIKNCKKGEVITVDGDGMFISTSLVSHSKINNDFNYNFLRIGNSYKNRDNHLTVSIPCKIELRYTPVIKDAP